MSKTREALEAARKSVEDKKWAVLDGLAWADQIDDGEASAKEARWFDALLAQIDAALDWQPSDSGPWVADGDGIASHDFSHDAILRIDGDFADAEQKAEFAQMIADRLNRSYAQIDAALAEQQAIAAQPAGIITAEHLQRAVAEARRQALEDAAKACIGEQVEPAKSKEHPNGHRYPDDFAYNVGLRHAAAAIRALKDQEPKPSR